jgi:hypothetical protein
MSGKGTTDDVAGLLYIVPFLASGIFGLYTWLSNGASSISGANVYLTVTRDPYVFLVGSFAVIAAGVLDVNGADPASRRLKAASVGSMLQSLAVASVVLALIGVWAATGFTDGGDAVNDFIVGRYAIIFPAMLVLLSYLVTVDFRVEALGSPKAIAIIALLASPAAVYAVGRKDTALGLAIGLALALFGILLYLRPPKPAAATAAGQQ